MRGLETLLFWLTLVASAALLAPCLVLPPWLEYQAQRDRLQAAQRQAEILASRVQAVEKQIDHLQNDPAYVLRLAQQEFGEAILPPGAETVRIEMGPDTFESNGPTAASVEPLPAAEDVLPELSAFLQQVLQRYPHAQVFVNPRSRPVLLGFGGVLLLTAIVLLGRAGVARPAVRKHSGR